MSSKKDENNDKSMVLSEEDIQKLIKSPFDKKIDITKKIAEYYKSGGFDEEQMITAARIFGTLVKDTEVEIRKTLAEAIKDNSEIPHEIIMSLAQDVQEVSLPVLEFSEVLTDVDLIEIVHSSQDTEKQKSISKRYDVSEDVTDALVETHNDQVVDSLLHNETAHVSEEAYTHIVEEFKDNEHVMEAMVERESLPVSVIENLAHTISNSIYAGLADRHPEAFSRMDNVIKKSRDMATMKVIGLRSSDAEYYQFTQLMEKLKISDELAPIYALCMANMNIFEVKIARMTQTPVLNVRTLLDDSSNKGFKVLYDRASLPEGLYYASAVLINALRKLNEKYPKNTDHDKKEIAGHLELKIYEMVPDTNEVPNLDYILSLVSHYAVTD